MSELKRQLGLTEALGLGIGGTIGGGIFVLVGAAAGLAGPAVLLSFVLAFAASLSIALPYAELSCRFPQAGGGYAFTRSVFGRGWGYLMGWGYWGGYLFISGYVTLGFGGYLHALTGIPIVLGGVGLVTFCVLLNLMGVKMSGRIQTIVIAFGILSLIGFSLIGLPRMSQANLSPFFPTGVSGVLLATLLCFLAFGGFDMVAAAGEEIKNSGRNLPYATVLTLVSVLGLYLLVTYISVGLLPWQELAASRAPLSLAASNSMGPTFGPTFIALAAVLTTAATANAVLVVTSRVMFAMSRDGVFPKALSLVSKSSGAPWTSIICCGLILGVVSAFGSIALATAIGGFLYVVHFMFLLAAAVKLRRKDAKLRYKGETAAVLFHMPAPYVILPIAIVFAVTLILASGNNGIIYGSSWLALGALAYLISRKLSWSSSCRGEQPS